MLFSLLPSSSLLSLRRIVRLRAVSRLFFGLALLLFLPSSACLPLVDRACASEADCAASLTPFCLHSTTKAPCKAGDSCICSATQCSPGTSRPCYTGDPSTQNVGLCKGGVESCTSNGRWSACEGEITPTCEICDKQDNDCDGQIDNLPSETAAKVSCRQPLHPETFCQCPVPGASRSCYTGPTSTLGASLCKAGLQYCDDDNRWGPCFDAILPSPERCDGIDNDCNGKIDDHPSCTCRSGTRRSCFTGPAQADSYGLCKSGLQTCGKDELWETNCVGQALPAKEDTCNGRDDDCDGLVDEACSCKADTDCRNPRSHPDDKSRLSPREFKACCLDKCRDTLSDPAFCTPSQTCTSAPIAPVVCQPHEICCKGFCVDPRHHPKNCGGCGTACLPLRTPDPGNPANPDAEVCIQGRCLPIKICPADPALRMPLLKVCEEVDPHASGPSASELWRCVDLQSDPQHCGDCKKFCDKTRGLICLQGRCENRCSPGQILCTQGAIERCADIRSDSEHCGACFQRCPTRTSCIASVCLDREGKVVAAIPYTPRPFEVPPEPPSERPHENPADGGSP